MGRNGLILRAANQLTGIEIIPARTVPRTAIIKVSIVGFSKVKRKLRLGGKNLEIVISICFRLAILLQSVLTTRREYPNQIVRIKRLGYHKWLKNSNNADCFVLNIFEFILVWFWLFTIMITYMFQQYFSKSSIYTSCHLNEKVNT